ncbi:MAG: hypothetical protein ACYDEX_08065 [Mobilitalea sp.]
MKEWNKPEMKELNVSNTEGFARSGDTVDGHWESLDGTVRFDTYTGCIC